MILVRHRDSTLLLQACAPLDLLLLQSTSEECGSAAGAESTQPASNRSTGQPKKMLSCTAGKWPRQPIFSGQNMNAGQPDNYII